MDFSKIHFHTSVNINLFIKNYSRYNEKLKKKQSILKMFRTFNLHIKNAKKL